MSIGQDEHRTIGGKIDILYLSLNIWTRGNTLAIRDVWTVVHTASKNQLVLQ